MTATYQLTLDDYREATRTPIVQPKPGRKRRSLWVGLIGWALFLILALILWAVVRTQPGQGWAGPEAPIKVIVPTGWVAAARFARANLYSLLAFGLFAWAALHSAIARPAKGWLVPKQAKIGGIGLLLAVLVPIGFFVLREVVSTPTRAEAARMAAGGASAMPTAFETLLATAPWGLLLALTLAINALARGRGVRVRWEAQPFLHEPYALVASAAGMTLEEPKATLRYAWNSFVGYRETENLLLLYTSPYGFWFIPKRAFAEPGDLETFKGLLLTHVREGTFLPAASVAFPVLLARHA